MYTNIQVKNLPINLPIYHTNMQIHMYIFIRKSTYRICLFAVLLLCFFQ